MASTGSSQIRTRGSYGGSRVVFYTPAHSNSVLITNGMVINPQCAPSVGGKIFAGDFGYFNYKTGVVDHLKTFKLVKALAASDTEVYFAGGEYDQNPNGVVVMKAPTTGTGTGAAAMIMAEKTTLAGEDVYKATITAGALGTGAVGDVFVEASEAGTGKNVKVPKVNMIFGGDVDINFPLTLNMDEWSKMIKGINGYYKETLWMEAVNIPPYVLSLNKLSNNEQLFEL